MQTNETSKFILASFTKEKDVEASFSDIQEGIHIQLGFAYSVLNSFVSLLHSFFYIVLSFRVFLIHASINIYILIYIHIFVFFLFIFCYPLKNVAATLLTKAFFVKIF